MAKQRVQVKDLSDPAPIQPQAQQVNVYHNPLTPLPAEDNSALQLARGLAALRPSLYQAADIAVDKETKEGEAQALLAERTQNRDGITSAVKAGAIPAGASPWFQKGWNRQKNRILADQYATDLQKAYAQWGDRDNEKGDLQSFMQGHLQEFLSQRGVDQADPEFTNVFAPMAAQIQERQNAEYGAHRVNLIEKQVIENTGAEVSSILDLPYLYGGAENQARVISATLSEHVKNGADGSTMNKVAVDAITQKAIQSGDTSFLNQLDLIDTGSGRLGRTLYAREERLKAENHIYAQRDSKLSSEWTQSERSRKLASEALKSSALKRLLADPQEDPNGGINADLSDLLKDAGDIDPETVKEIVSLRSSLQGMRQSGSIAVGESAQVYSDIYSGKVSHGDLIAMASDPNRGWSQDQVRDFTIAIEKYEQASGRGGILRDPFYNDTQARIKRAIISSDYAPHEASQDLAFIKADSALAQYMINFTAQNPPPSVKDTQNELVRLESELIRRYSVREGAQTFTHDPIEALKESAKPEKPKKQSTEPGSQSK
jgi:hypothetical protein